MEIDYEARESVSRQLADWIIRMIRSGELRPGQRVPSETDMVRRFGIARTTARRVHARLRDEGWITTVAGRGNYVNERPVPPSGEPGDSSM